jgi:pyrophosphatase PpaX
MSKETLIPTNLKTVLFDLDGTLLDSFSAHFKAYEGMFAKLGMKITQDEFLRCYSPNWYETYQAVGLPREAWELADAHWLEESAKQEPRLFPGVMDFLLRLRSRFVLGLVTSGSKSRVLRDLTRTGITECFQVIVTGDDVREPKPSPEGLHVALEKLGLQPKEALYVGDAQADYEMARAAGVAFLGVASKFSGSTTDDEYLRVDSIGRVLKLLLGE